MDQPETCEYPWCRSRDIAILYLGKPLCADHQAPPSDEDAAVAAWRAALRLPERKVLTSEEFKAALGR
jgi:hypothetical protein